MNLYSDKNYVNVSREYYNFIKKCLIPEEKRNFLQDSDIVEPGKDSQNNSYYTPLMIAQDLLVKVTKLYRENIVPELLIDQHPLWIKQVDMLEKMITALSKQNYDADYDNVSGRVPDNQIFFE